MSYFYVFCTILLTVYGQLIIKWQVLKAGSLPEQGYDKLYFIIQLLVNPWIISAFAAGLLASATWMAAMTKLPLSYAYPFMSLAFVMVIVFSAWFFNEPITPPKIIGCVIVAIGLIIGSQG